MNSFDRIEARALMNAAFAAWSVSSDRVRCGCGRELSVAGFWHDPDWRFDGHQPDCRYAVFARRQRVWDGCGRKLVVGYGAPEFGLDLSDLGNARRFIGRYGEDCVARPGSADFHQLLPHKTSKGGEA